VSRHRTSVTWCPGRHSCAKPYSGEDVHAPGLAQIVAGWSHPDSTLRFAIPVHDRDVHGYDALQFRAATNPAYKANQGVGVQDLPVELGDANGHVAWVAASAVGNAALANLYRKHEGWHFILNQVRFPLRRFAGVNLRNVKWVQLSFDRRDAGVVDISDMAFTR